MLNIIDAHAHLGPWPKFYSPCRDVNATVSMMDHLGISYTITAHHAGLAGLLTQAQDWSEDAYVRSNGRILSYIVYDPTQVVESLRVIKSAMGRPYFAGIKIHPTMHKCPADDDLYAPMWEFADAHGLVVLAHTWNRSKNNPDQDNSHPDLFKRYITASPSTKVILGHAGGSYTACRACVRLAKKHSNVWVDLTGDTFALGRLDYLVRELSSERILFGSDMPWMDPRFALGELLGASISDEECTNILGLNAIRLFNLAVSDTADSLVAREAVTMSSASVS